MQINLNLLKNYKAPIKTFLEGEEEIQEMAEKFLNLKYEKINPEVLEFLKT